ncbi:unnamed protein product [Oikopleura dioica]|uniref:Secreted protein n=1 Tax=Oikopleura dioica TaxID=34765 RepID=E4WVT5_OIKDI|nr:unnamed protein product [Oikopleura dioica]CBY31668.1 unnamed protein product [Oikopleura dioica]
MAFLLVEWTLISIFLTWKAQMRTTRLAAPLREPTDHPLPPSPPRDPHVRVGTPGTTLQCVRCSVAISAIRPKNQQ